MIILDNLNIFISGIFFIEMIIKLIGLGIKRYFKDRFNTFDCFIVVLSTIDTVLTFSIDNNQSATGALTAFRAFRLLRVFKLVKSWKKLQQLLSTIAKTIKDVSNFSVLLFLFIFTYTLLGMDLFAYKVNFNAEDRPDPKGSPPDSNFNNLGEAFISVFIVLANDGWSTIYFNHYRTVGAVPSILFFHSLIIIGQFLLLNLFLAILLQNFEEDSITNEI